MIERPKLVLLLTVLSISGLAVLYAYSASIGPIEVQIADIGPEHEGKLVCVEGMVTDVSSTQGGMVFFSLVDLIRPGIVTVFMDGEVAEKVMQVVEGDISRVAGIVAYYDGEPEVIPTSEKDVELVQRDGIISPGPDALLANPEQFRGVTIGESGVVEDIPGEGWIFLSLSEKHSLVVKSQTNTTLGSEFIVYGTMEYDEYHGWWYLNEMP